MLKSVISYYSSLPEYGNESIDIELKSKLILSDKYARTIYVFAHHHDD